VLDGQTALAGQHRCPRTGDGLLVLISRGDAFGDGEFGRSGRPGRTAIALADCDFDDVLPAVGSAHLIHAGFSLPSARRASSRPYGRRCAVR
jgi:hypothetical protein